MPEIYMTLSVIVTLFVIASLGAFLREAAYC